MSALAAVVPAAGAIFRGAFAHNRVRVALSVAAIALGVALAYAIALINRAAVNELAQGVQMQAGDADLEVRGPRGGFDEALYPKLAALPEIAVASPLVEVDAKLAKRDEVLRIIGLDVFRAGQLQPGLVPAGGDRLDALRPDALFLSPAAAHSLALAPGDAVEFQVGMHDVSLRIKGLLGASTRQRIAVADIAAVQQQFERLGRLTRIDLRVRPGVDVAALRERLARELPPGIAIDRPEASVSATASLSRSYRVNLNVLALVALFTGSLLVFSTQALAVVRRRPQLALFRVLGVTRRQLIASVVAESAVIGVAGSVLGVLAGYALAAVALRYGGADLGSGFFRGVAPQLGVEPVSLALISGLGIVAAIAGGVAPAVDAARAAPAAALKAGDDAQTFTQLASPVPGLAVCALGIAMTLLPAVDGLPLFGYGAIALLVVGTLMLMPRLADAMLSLAWRPRSVPPQLALAQLRGAPGQVGLSLATIVASVSLMVSMAVMVASFRASLDAWLLRVLPADVYLRASAGGDTGYLPPDVQQSLTSLPGLARIELLREEQVLLDPARPRIVLLVRPVDAATIGERLPLVDRTQLIATNAPPPVWVSEVAAGLYGFGAGDVIALPLAGARVQFTVAGVFRDYARQQGAIVIDRDRYVALTGDRRVTGAALWAATPDGAEALRARVVGTLRGADKLDIALPGEMRAISLSIFDRTFAITYALELAAVVIGLVGLSATFGARVLSRRREFGMLRHIGMTRAQIGSMLAIEGALLTGIGLVVGSALGMLISLILIHVVNRQSFHWSMDFALPWAALATFLSALLALATLTAVVSGRQAMSVDVVRAVKDDW